MNTKCNKKAKIGMAALLATTSLGYTTHTLLANDQAAVEEKIQEDATLQEEASTIQQEEGSVEINETNFPDANFKKVVKGFDRDGDNVLSAEEIASVTEIVCTGRDIQSLQGIEYFTALTKLECYNNPLTSLDVSQNTALQTLFCHNNQLTSLDVSQNTALRDLYCYNNQLTSLELSNNTALRNLNCSSNKLTSLDVSKNTALRDLYCSNNQLTSLDMSQNTALEWLCCDNNQLTSLDVSQNTALLTLHCYNNQLMSLDLANNPNITNFKGEGQTIELGEISKDQYDLNIKDPNIDSNKIVYPTGATFNGTVMSGYTRGTPVTYKYDTGKDDYKLNVTLNFDLPFIKSDITYKDGNTDFDSWKADYTPPSTYTEEVGVALPTADNIEKEGYTFVGWYADENFTGAPITEIDAAATGDKTLYAKFEINQYTETFKDVEINETNFPDANFRKVVKGFDRDGDNVLSAEEIGSVTMINCNNQNIHSLKGIEYFTALRTLYCQNSQLTSLDVSQNTALRILYCDGNQLTSLDVSKNTELRELYCDGNQLTSLDVSQNTALWRLHCNTNQLTSLELGKNTKLLYLYCYDNQLTSLDVSQNTSLIGLYCNNNQLMSLDLANNPKITNFKGEGQTIELGEISKDQYDLNIKDPNIDSNKIEDPTGATFNGTVMSGYTRGTPVTYKYDTGKDDYKLNVTLNFDLPFIKYDITYKDGNADFDSWKADYTPPSTYTEEVGVALPTADNIEKEGYTFVGWYADENFTGDPITEIDAAATGEKTLYAKFEINQYTVTFKDWDGNVLKEDKVEYNTAAIAPANPTREGYRFTGWDKTFDAITDNTEVTAQYVKTWTVIFKDEDGNELKTETVDEGATATAPEAPTKEGYRFTGWDVQFDKITGDTVVTAQYEKEEAIVSPTEPEKPQTPGESMDGVQTGDTTQTSVWAMLVGLSMSMMYFFRRKKNR